MLAHHVHVPVSVARATERALLDEATTGLATARAEESVTDAALAAVSAELAALEGAAPPAAAAPRAAAR